jgi:hypothetical protein
MLTRVCRSCGNDADDVFELTSEHGLFCSKLCQEKFQDILAAGEAKLERRLDEEVAAEFIRRGAEPARTLKLLATGGSGWLNSPIPRELLYPTDEKAVRAFVDRVKKLVLDPELRRKARESGKNARDEDLPDWLDIGEIHSFLELELRAYHNIIMRVFHDHALALAGYRDNAEFRIEVEVKRMAAALTLDEYRGALDAVLRADEFPTTVIAAQIYEKRRHLLGERQQREAVEMRKAVHQRYYGY